MCAQYLISANPKELSEHYGLSFANEAICSERIWSERIYPFTQAPVITEQGLRLMNFSLIPSWSPVRKPKFATYNARIETVQDKASWKKPFINSHCLVPLNAFIEPIYEGPWGGNMVRFGSQSLRTAAGIWDRWIDQGTGEVVDSFAILTQEPSDFIRHAGHDRQPIFLQDSHCLDWIRSKNQDFLRTKEALEKITWQDPSFEIALDRALKKSP